MTDIKVTTHKDPIKPSVEAIEDLQRSIDYWAERCLKAEHEIERLRADNRALNRELDLLEEKSRYE